MGKSTNKSKIKLLSSIVELDELNLKKLLATNLDDCVSSINSLKDFASNLPYILQATRISYRQLAGQLGISTSKIHRRIHKPELWDFETLEKTITILKPHWNKFISKL